MKMVAEKRSDKSRFTTIYLRSETKKRLDSFKVVDNETNDNVINRLMDRANWKVVDGNIVYVDSRVINDNIDLNDSKVKVNKDLYKELIKNSVEV